MRNRTWFVVAFLSIALGANAIRLGSSGMPVNNTLIAGARASMKRNAKPISPTLMLAKGASPQHNLTGQQYLDALKVVKAYLSRDVTHIEQEDIKQQMIADFTKAGTMDKEDYLMLFRLLSDNVDLYQKVGRGDPARVRSNLERDFAWAHKHGWAIMKTLDAIFARRAKAVLEAPKAPSARFGALAPKLDRQMSVADLDAATEMFAYMAVNTGHANRVTPASFAHVRQQLEDDFDEMPSDMQTFMANAEPIYDNMQDEFEDTPDNRTATILEGFGEVLDSLGLFDEDEGSGGGGGGGGGESSGGGGGDSDWDTKSGLVINTAWNLAAKSSGGW